MVWVKKHQKFLWGIAAGALATVLIINRHWFAPLHEPTMAVLNSNATTAFMGAFAGAFVVYFMSWLEKQRSLLADINTATGELSGLINTLLGFKRQQVLPLAKNYNDNVQLYNYKASAAEKGLNDAARLQLALPFLSCSDLHFDLPTDRIYANAVGAVKIVPIIAQTKRTMGGIKSAYDLWNQQIEVLKTIKDDAQRAMYYFGQKDPDGNFNATFHDALSNLVYSVDEGLVLCQLSIDRLHAMAKVELPFWLKNKVARTEIVDPQSKKLMPPKDSLKGWADE